MNRESLYAAGYPAVGIFAFKNKGIKDTAIRLVAVLFSFVFALGLIAPASVYGANNAYYYPSAGQTIRIGWYQSPGFQEGAKDEKKSGYGYDYLQVVAEYTEWKYEYVYGDWSTLFEMLEKGDIDMLAGVATSEERKRKMLFPTYSMGTDKYYLYQHAENRVMNSADLASFEGLTIGGVKNTRMTSYVENWAKRNHLNLEIVQYDGFEQRDAAFASYLVDGICATDTNVPKNRGYAPVIKVGEEPVYMAVSQSRPDVLASLNNALRMIDQTDPYYWQTLQYQYYGMDSETGALTEKEVRWLDSHPELKVGYVSDYMPFCKTDENGNAVGVVKDLFENILTALQIEDRVTLHYIPFDSFVDMTASLGNGEIDMAFPTMDERRYLDDRGILGTSDIIAVPFYVAFTGNYSDKTFDVIALNSQPIQKITDDYPDARILHEASANDCLDAVLNGDATCTIMASYRLNALLGDSKYRKINTIPFGSNFSYCIGIAKEEKSLNSIINKGIILIDKAVITDRLFKYIQDEAKYSFRDFIMDNLYTVLGIAFLMAMIVLLIFMSYVNGIRKAKIKTDQALLMAQRANDAKSVFLSRMSHDIRTPLNGIIGLLEISEKHKDDAALLDRNREKEKIAANHLLGLVNDILDMSKFEDENFVLPCEPFNLYTVCVEVITIGFIRANENGIETITDSGENIIYPNVYGSPLHFRQIMMNLINNGIKYNKPGGTISCTSELSAYDGQTVTYIFTISDTGIGIGEEYLEHIYEPFSQEKNDSRSRYQGSGMGMAIVKTLVDKMGGSISVESKVGVGTTFRVTIPFMIDPHPDAQEDQAAFDASIEGMRILVVEDNDLNMEIARTILEDEGAITTGASNGREAVNLFLEKDEGTFDLILMDIMMPEIDGYEATRQIRRSDKADAATIPIIAMTANAFVEDIQQSRAAGMNDHLAKPLQMDSLLATLFRYRSH